MKNLLALKTSKLVMVFYMLVCSGYTYSASPVIAEGTNYSIRTIIDRPVTFTVHASDADGDQLTWTILNYHTDGSIKHWSAGGFTYTPSKGISTDAFSLRVSDGGSHDDIAISVTIEEPLYKHDLTVRRHTSASSLSNADADDILLDGYNILKYYNGSGDKGCNVRLARLGNVTTFTSGDGSISSASEWGALADGINFVNDIGWCGSLAPNILGCGTTPGKRIAVVNHSLSDIIWVHEFGHNQGLTHRDESNVIMAPVMASGNKRVNLTECNAYKNNAPIVN